MVAYKIPMIKKLDGCVHCLRKKCGRSVFVNYPVQPSCKNCVSGKYYDIIHIII